MLNLSLIHGRTSFTRWARAFSTTLHLKDSRPIWTTKVVGILRKETRDPLWKLVESLRTKGRRLELSAALHNSGISAYQFQRWKPVLYQRDISSTVELLQQQGFSLPRMKNAAGEVVPSWVALYLVGYAVRTPLHANGPMMDLVYAHLDTMSVDGKSALLIFAALHLSRFNLLVPLRRVVDSFFLISLSNTTVHALYFNLLLRIVSSNPTQSLENAELAVSILMTMESRQMRLHSPTLEALFNDRFVMLQLTKVLRRRMAIEGFIPSAAHFEAYLKIFAQQGAIHNLEEYYKAIHRTIQTPPEHVSHSSSHSYFANAILAPEGDRTSAFAFLRNLNKPITPIALGTWSAVSNRPGHSLGNTTHKIKFDTLSHTFLLNALGRDRAFNKKDLLKSFGRTQPRFPSVRLTTAAYTALIHGLLLRKQFKKAEQYWKIFLSTGLKVDNKALSVGLRTLCRIGKPHRAFALLETHCAQSEPCVQVTYQLHKPVIVTPTTMNDFLVALKRIGRPDVVFRLWDHMGELYGVFPDSRTLSILLQSARLASRLDDSLSGAIAQLALKNPFRRPSKRPHSRDDIVASIKAVVGEPNRGIEPYVSGVWNNERGADVARKAFLRALFGNAQEVQQLLRVPPPAFPVRLSADAETVTALGMPRLRPLKLSMDIPRDLLMPDGRIHYPHIVVSDANCFEYFALLGIASRAGEIPQILAWMRELRIIPSRHTLALGLALWSEISLQAPLIEDWMGEEGSEYKKLERWIVDWLGQTRLPSEPLLEKWRAIVSKMRKGPKTW